MKDTAIYAGILAAMLLAIIAGIMAYMALVSKPVCSQDKPATIIIDVHGASEDDIEIYRPQEELAPIVDII